MPLDNYFAALEAIALREGELPFVAHRENIRKIVYRDQGELQKRGPKPPIRSLPYCTIAVVDTSGVTTTNHRHAAGDSEFDLEIIYSSKGERLWEKADLPAGRESGAFNVAPVRPQPRSPLHSSN